MGVSVKGNAINTIYERGDTCLEIVPFDSYRLFTLYQDWKDNTVTLDLSNSQCIYLVFKSKNKEVRIPEYNTEGSKINVDKVNGQVLFKINQKNALNILSMDNRIFYITRVYETYNPQEGSIIPSDEEAIYMGKWFGPDSVGMDSLTNQIKNLTALLEERNQSIHDLQQSNAELIQQNVDLATELEDTKAANDELEAKVNDLETENDGYKSGDQYDGFVVGDGTHYKILSNEKCTEAELLEILKTQEEIIRQ